MLHLNTQETVLSIEKSPLLVKQGIVYQQYQDFFGWTDNLSRAHRVAGKLKAGTVSVNTVDALSPMTPFGGFKQSGIGRDLSIHAFDKFTQLKTTWIEIKA